MVSNIVVEVVTLFVFTKILDPHAIPFTVIGGSLLLLVDYKVIIVKAESLQFRTSKFTSASLLTLVE